MSVSASRERQFLSFYAASLKYHPDANSNNEGVCWFPSTMQHPSPATLFDDIDAQVENISFCHSVLLSILPFLLLSITPFHYGPLFSPGTCMFQCDFIKMFRVKVVRVCVSAHSHLNIKHLRQWVKNAGFYHSTQQPSTPHHVDANSRNKWECQFPSLHSISPPPLCPTIYTSALRIPFLSLIPLFHSELFTAFHYTFSQCSIFLTWYLYVSVWF